MEKYEKDYQIYSAGTVVDAIQIKGNQARKGFLKKYATSSLIQMLIGLRYNMNLQHPEFLKEYSERLSGNPVKIRETNPAVWEATTNTMRFAAFFRYCKSNFPNVWKGFVKQIEKVNVKPNIETPTVLWLK